MAEKRKDDHLTVRVKRSLKKGIADEAKAAHRSASAQMRMILERVMELPEDARKMLLDGKLVQL